MNQGWQYTNQIHLPNIGQTVLDFYVQKYQHSNQKQWLNRIESGQILLNDKPTTPETRLQLNQVLTYQRPPWQEPEVPLKFKILYEDSDLWIIHKPEKLPVLPGGQFLEHTLLRQLQKHYPNETPLPIHRLGRGTSGLMILARSKAVRASLSQQMRDRTIQKHYLALVSSGTMPNYFTINQLIGKIPYPKLGYVYGACAEGKEAISHCHVIERKTNATIIGINIQTGRPHQIRIHLAAYGYPLIGDPLYAMGGVPKLLEKESESQAIPSDCGYWLHSHQLKLLHPVHKQLLSFVSEAPKILQTSR